jgi:3-dehydroquinate synthase
LKFKMPLLKFSRSYPAAKVLQPRKSLLLYDRVLDDNKWFEQFPYRIALESGESLKDLRRFPEHMENILRMVEQIPERPLQVIAIGGGSLGDFAGFVASILKRGVELIQIPSTWLAAMDSAHGGKNALNVSHIKNQIGTFHFPSKIYLIQELLISQPRERIEDAYGEALKISLIEGKELWKKFANIKNWTAIELWKILPRLIEAKYKVIRRDPFERKGLRHILNLGHTLGHVFEAETGLSHGRAVLQGLGFALRWSQKRNLLKQFDYPMEDHLPTLQRLKDPAKYLRQDKKRVGSSQIRFVFLAGPGRAMVKNVSLAQILEEIERQRS